MNNEQNKPVELTEKELEGVVGGVAEEFKQIQFNVAGGKEKLAVDAAVSVDVK